MKKTAVEWFSKKLKLLLLEKDIGLDIMSFMKKYDELFKQAKAMEKEQIIDAYLKDRKRRDFLNALKLMDKAEEYYNKTYKTNKQII